nr:uncharacterized protein LOC121470960 [Taeniopygia guttata]
MPAELGIQFSVSEEDTLDVWKFLARHHSLCVSEEVLWKFLSWVKAHTFPKDVVSSLDPRVWDSLSLCLLGELRQGGRSPRQLPMWSLLSKAVRGQTPLESEPTLVGTSQSGLEEHFPLGRWPSAFPPQTSGNNPFTDSHRWFLPPPHRGVGATLPTEHSKQLAPGFWHMCRSTEAFSGSTFAVCSYSERSCGRSCPFAFASTRGTIASSSPCGMWIGPAAGFPHPAPQEGAEPPLPPTRGAAGSLTAASSPVLESMSSPPVPQPEASASAASPGAPAGDTFSTDSTNSSWLGSHLGRDLWHHPTLLLPAASPPAVSLGFPGSTDREMTTVSINSLSLGGACPHSWAPARAAKSGDRHSSGTTPSRSRSRDGRGGVPRSCGLVDAWEGRGKGETPGGLPRHWQRGEGGRSRKRWK